MEDPDFLALIDPELHGCLEKVKELYSAPFARDNGVEIVRIAKDSVRLRMRILPKHLNSMGRVHGAAIFLLADHTFAFADNLFEDGVGFSTTIEYHRPPMGDVLESVSEKLNSTKSTATYIVKVECQGKLVATALCTAFRVKK